MGLIDDFREGAADLLGIGADRHENDLYRARLLEANADARLMARKLEDSANWSNTGEMTPTSIYDANRVVRNDQVRKAYRYYFNDPIIRRTVDLSTLYTFGKGIPRPSYRDNVDDADAEELLAQAHIDALWADSYNQETLFSLRAQFMKSLELQLQGNVFLLLFRNEYAPQGDPDQIRRMPSALTMTDIPHQEVVEIIHHPGMRKVPVFYKRVYTPQEYDFDASTEYGEGTYKAKEPVTIYYRHWRNEAPERWNGKEWGPDRKKIAAGRIYHITANRTSDMKFGISELNSYLKWAQGLNEYMTSRMATVQAIAQFALQLKVAGARQGTKQVSQAVEQLRDISRLAGQVEGTTDLSRLAANQGRTKIAASNENAQLEPMVQDTNAGNAQMDSNIFKGQVAAGSGIGVVHLGTDPSIIAAGAVAQDAPLMRMIEFRQELWKDVMRDLHGYHLETVGLEVDRVEINMPAISPRDIVQVAAALGGMVQVADPQISNRDLVRFFVGEVLDSMGKTNTQELLDKFFPTTWKSPARQQIEQQLSFAAIQNAGALQGAGGDPQAGIDNLTQAALATATNGGAANVPRSGDQYPGGPAAKGQDSYYRAQDRQRLALEAYSEAAADDPEVIELLEHDIVETDLGGQRVTVPPVLTQLVKSIVEDPDFAEFEHDDS